MDIAELKFRKEMIGWTNEELAQASGVPLSTVQKVMSKATRSPRRSTLAALESAIEKEEEAASQRHKRALLEGIESSKESSRFKEAASNYSDARKMEWHTIADYYALPDDRRVELIDGVFYDLAAPSMKHQLILGELYSRFHECIKQHNLPCRVFFAPCDVQLDQDDYTMVKPDLMIICHGFDKNAMRYKGAPDFVLEVLSPSTRSMDMFKKLAKYHDAGIREYWIVDPEYQRVIVHWFEPEDYEPERFSFNDTIPVHISNGLCSIDFSQISDI